jgi:chromosome segregation ATPase
LQNGHLLAKEKELQRVSEEYEEYKKRAQTLVSQQNLELDELRKIKNDDSKLKAEHEELKKSLEDLQVLYSKSEQQLTAMSKLEENLRSSELMKEDLLGKLRRSDTLWAAEVQAVQMKIDAEKESHVLGKIIV